jgi:hypothetical protein
LQDVQTPKWRDEATGRVYCIDLEYWVNQDDLLDFDTSDDSEDEEYDSIPAQPRKSKDHTTDSWSARTCASNTDVESLAHHSDFATSYPHEYAIESNDFQLCDRIGQGRTAVVWKGYFKGVETNDVAIKQISALCDDRKVLQFLGNICALRSTPHPNIVQMLGVTLGVQPVHLVTEHCVGGSCYDLVHSSASLTDMQAGKICADVAEAMSHLHALSPKILHRNLTSHNVLLAQAVTCSTIIPHAKVSDFNLARLTSDIAAECSVGGSIWMAPEVMCGALYSDEADVYSFAMFMYEVLYRKTLFENVHATNLQSLITEGVRARAGKRRCRNFLCALGDPSWLGT